MLHLFGFREFTSILYKLCSAPFGSIIPAWDSYISLNALSLLLQKAKACTIH